MLICCLKNYNSIIFFRILRWTESSKAQHLFKIKLFCNNLKVCTVTFDQVNRSLMNNKWMNEMLIKILNFIINTFQKDLITLILNYTLTEVNKPCCSNPGTKCINRLHINLHTQTKDGSSFTTGCKKTSVRQIGYICSVKHSKGVQEQLISIKISKSSLTPHSFT